MVQGGKHERPGIFASKPDATFRRHTQHIHLMLAGDVDGGCSKWQAVWLGPLLGALTNADGLLASQVAAHAVPVVLSISPESFLTLLQAVLHPHSQLEIGDGGASAPSPDGQVCAAWQESWISLPAGGT